MYLRPVSTQGQHAATSLRLGGQLELQPTPQLGRRLPCSAAPRPGRNSDAGSSSNSGLLPLSANRPSRLRAVSATTSTRTTFNDSATYFPNCSNSADHSELLQLRDLPRNSASYGTIRRRCSDSAATR